VGAGAIPGWLPTGTATAGGVGGGIVLPVRRGVGGGWIVVGGRGGSWTPVGGALRARRGGSGGRRRPHAWHEASSSAFSALQNGQNRMISRPAQAAQSVSPIAR
jgi:hypothetical protein